MNDYKGTQHRLYLFLRTASTLTIFLVDVEPRETLKTLQALNMQRGGILRK